MQATATRPQIIVTADGVGVVSHVGSRLQADVADRTTLTSELSGAMLGLRRPCSRHDTGRNTSARSARAGSLRAAAARRTGLHPPTSVDRLRG